MSQAFGVAGCQWLEPGGRTAALAIEVFLNSTGIALKVEPITGKTLVPGLAIAEGRIVIDPDKPAYPGDLLHEAGHIAVVEPERRASLSEVGIDPGNEMAAIAWSVAAARACGVELEVLFHPEGYKGGSANLIADFRAGQPFGVPLLAWYGMTGAEIYPEMTRWLR